NSSRDPQEKNNRRKYGEHLTSKDFFLQYIFPEIKQILMERIWVDLYAGEGNLILPILNFVPDDKKELFFKNQVYLFDAQPKLVQKCQKNAIKYGISPDIVQKNVVLRDNLESYPDFLKKKSLPIFHITNPPYLYLGYIRKHEETQAFLNYFRGENKGYQDLYQIAMMNDLKNGIIDLIYIIPSNFLYGASVSNKFRRDFLKWYEITKMLVFETKIFEFTGTNTCVGFFKRKKIEKQESICFTAHKFNKQGLMTTRNYALKPEYKYRAGSEFEEFLIQYRSKHPFSVNYYFKKEEVEENRGYSKITAIDANKYENNEYKTLILSINDQLKQKIEKNGLYIRTVDTGSSDGRVGLGKIQEDFQVDAIYVSGNTYRTHPIQVFIEPKLSSLDQAIMQKYFNLVLEHFREKLDSEFLTTYKYSNTEYTRKYLGLSQARRIIETFPLSELRDEKITKLFQLVEQGNFKELKKFLKLIL
ncbi:MAG: N-6 DNA methylase, partial [Promethearchaeota archaeon]